MNALPPKNEDDGASMMGAGYVGDDFGEKGPQTYTTSRNLLDIFPNVYQLILLTLVLSLMRSPTVVDVLYVNTLEE